MPAWGEYHQIGETRDDAAGEAFDKVGALLGLDYPAGAAIEKLAATGDPTRFRFPRPLLKGVAHADRFAFSFSGLKTAVLRAVQQSPDLEADRAHIARGFQDAAIEVMLSKTVAAAKEFGRELIVLGGGVACNRTLADALRRATEGIAHVSVASPRLNTDNAAMIGAAGAWRLVAGERHLYDLEARDTFPLPGLIPPVGTTP